MTHAEIHKIIHIHGLVKGTIIHRIKMDGRTVGLDELRYNEGRKSLSRKVKGIYEAVINKSW